MLFRPVSRSLRPIQLDNLDHMSLWIRHERHPQMVFRHHPYGLCHPAAGDNGALKQARISLVVKPTIISP